MFAAALLGFAFGFIGSMPIAGPIAILVFGRGLENRARSGIHVAAGAAVAESAYAYLAFWGFSSLVVQYSWLEPVSRAAGALILTGLGLHFVRRRSSPEVGFRPVDPSVGNKRSFLLGFTITALNPTLMATYTAAVTTVYSMGIVSIDARGALPFAVGTAFGITIWFAVLLVLLARFRARFTPTTLDAVIRVMGLGLILLGLFFAYRFATYVAAS